MNANAMRVNPIPVSRSVPGIASILFSTDFSLSSGRAFPLAAALARRFAAKLLLVHVIAHQVHPEDFTFGPLASLEDRASAEDNMKALKRSNFLRGLDCSALVIEGEIAESLDKVIDDHRIDMAVVGTSAARGLRRLLFGSGAEQIYRHATCPVIVVGPNATFFETSGVVDSILVPIDFSEESLSALPYAALMAGQRGRILLLHVLSEVDPRLQRTTIRDCTQRLRVLVSERTHRADQTAVARESARYEFECVTNLGEPAEVILKHAQQSGTSVIVMGVHSTSRPATQIPWDTVRTVVRSAQCPVLVVKYPVSR